MNLRTRTEVPALQGWMATASSGQRVRTEDANADSDGQTVTFTRGAATEANRNLRQAWTALSCLGVTRWEEEFWGKEIAHVAYEATLISPCRYSLAWPEIRMRSSRNSQ
jgi:hypothetical protein